MTVEFKGFPKLPRLHRDVTITEKIDGTNACVIVEEREPGDLWIFAQSRKRLITIDDDNFGFAAWTSAHKHELAQLGVGYHYGEWYGKGIQRGYGLDERRFALFNPDTKNVPECCEVVPVLSRGNANLLYLWVSDALDRLGFEGSVAVPGFKPAEGIVVYHHAARVSFKVTLENDETPKALVA